MDKNKPVVLITGSSRGIGAGLAHFLAQKDYIPLITYNKHKEDAELLVQDLENEYNLLTYSYHLDLRSQKSIQELAQDISNHFEKIDILVCNAGVDYYHENFDEITLPEWQEHFEVKVFGTFLCVQHLLPLLKKSSNPNIITISASLAEKPDPLDPAYSSACAALNNLSKSLVYGLAKYSIRTNILCPGPMDTNLEYWKEMKKRNSTIFASFKDHTPLKRDLNPQDVARMIVSIYENYAINGNMIYVTNGSHLR